MSLTSRGTKVRNERGLVVMKKRISAFFLAMILVLTGSLSGLGFPLKAKADGGTFLKVHYHREDADYSDWDVWLWEEGKDGNGYAFEEENGEMVATMSVTPGTMRVGYIIRTSAWAKDIDADQFVDISEVVSGTVHIYIESGVEGCTKLLDEDVVVGTKLKSAKYDGEGCIEVTMTADVEDYREAFTVKGSAGEIGISEVIDKGDYKYMVSLSEKLEDSKSYTISFDDTEYKVNMPIVYSTAKFEEEYTYTGKDLGFTYSADKTSFRVWAPTAEAVALKRYKSGEDTASDLIEELPMTKDVNGTWVCEVKGDINGTYYMYAVTIDGKTTTATDPYARSTGINGVRSMVLNLEATNPEGWAEDKNPNADLSITDAIIYEGHIRDLTVGADNGIVNQGKFLGVSEEERTNCEGIPTGLDHMKELGITHLHLLPIYDFGSVDEKKSVVGVYNWGYDPMNFNVPEGSYSTDAHKGEVRVSEMKTMVKKLHENGISVVMDVVYNHVYNAESFCFNKIVPGYFSRISEEGTYSNGSGCGNDTATERSMVKKYIVDSVNYWADEYHIDGFRFDLVGLMDVETINEIVASVHEKHPDVIFYGEGWSLTTMPTKENVVLATQANSELTPGFAYFNDTIRDGLKGSVFDTGVGFVSGASGYESKIVRCFMGADNWCKSPSQTINYVSCHDNNTLYDRLKISCPDATEEEIVKMNKLAAAVYILSEGVPFMQAGEEMLRSKPNGDGTYNHNSYNAGDGVNTIEWSKLDNPVYADVYEYYRGLINFRKAHPVLRLSSAEDVSAHVTQINGLPSHVVGFDIKGEGTEGETAEEMYVIFNASEESQHIVLPEGNWNFYIKESDAGTEPMYTVIGDTIEVNALSTAVLIKEEAEVHLSKDTANPREGSESKTKKRAVAGATAAGLALVTIAAGIFRRKKK